MKSGLLVSLILFSTSFLPGRNLLAARAGKAPSILTGAKITLDLDRHEFFLGENILLHYCIENTGGPAFRVDVGGDYGGGTRANRFKITAMDADGKVVLDPDPVQWNMGGMSPILSLKTGSKWYEQVWLVRYCLFEKPGIYTVRIFHDLGWGYRKDPDPREVDVTLTIKRPTPEQAQKLVAEMRAAKTDSGNVWGQKANPRPDFSALRDPVYLPVLAGLARDGSLDGLIGIASIPTSDATRALVELLDPGADRPLAPGSGTVYLPSNAAATRLSEAAAVCLQDRLPKFPLKGPSYLRPDTLALEQLRRTWAPALNGPVRAFAHHLLAKPDRGGYLLAADELGSVGNKEDLPALTAAMDSAVLGTTNEFRIDHSYPEPITASGELASAYERISGGPGSLSTPTTPGQDFLYVRALKPQAAACPPGWEVNCAALLQNELPYLRAQTLAHLPRPLPESLVRLLPNLMLDPDIAVQNHAFVIADGLVAQGMEIPAHRDIALKVMSTTTDRLLLSAASGLALKYGASYECAAIWAKRLDETRHELGPSMPDEATMALFGIVTGGQVDGGFRHAPDATSIQDLKQRWVAFVEAHRDDLKAGRHFVPGDGVFPKDLLPEGWHYYPPKP